jgi:O-antigen ligase
MAKVTRYLLFLYVFTVSWDTVPLPVIGSVSRAAGLVAIAAALFTAVGNGRVRKPGAVLVCAIAFSGWSVLSLLWTISYQATVIRATTYVQLAASVWLMREFVRTREHVITLIAAFCLGLFVPLTDLLSNFLTGAAIGKGVTRFSGSELNADVLGLWVVIGMPMAWHMILHHRGIVRKLSVVYFAVAPLALLLTATRGAFLAGIVALTIVPITLSRQTLRTYVLAGALMTVGITAATLFVPTANWERILSIPAEITAGGTMTGRTNLWKGGLERFPERPITGYGAGAYGAVIGPSIRYSNAMAHNVAIGLLVEEGIVGLAMFAAVLGACAWTVLLSPQPYKALWGVLLLTWCVSSMSINLEQMKLTWVLFGFIAAQNGLMTDVRDSLSANAQRMVKITTPHLTPSAYTSHTA